MKCVVRLFNNNEEIEITTELENEIINKLSNFISEENISSEDLVHLMIDNFLEPECLY